jgi:hypothetical protein
MLLPETVRNENQFSGGPARNTGTPNLPTMRPDTSERNQNHHDAEPSLGIGRRCRTPSPDWVSVVGADHTMFRDTL